MAGNQNSGGYRPTAPQNNPANVSATGGAGQSGRQPARYISGGTYGQGQELMNQQQGAAMAKAPSPTAATPEAMVSNLPQATPITAPSERPDEPVTSGIAMGPGAGPEALMLPSAGDNDEDKQRLISYLPALESAALSPNSSQAFRNYVRVLRANLQ
jgi:hypothetical protein